jgi:hypothetical protein
MNEILGALMFLALAIGMAAFAAVQIGWRDALKLFGMVGALVGWIVLAAFLVTH